MEKLWLIGAGGMSVDYAKVLIAQNVNFTVIGRGEASAKSFTEKINAVTSTRTGEHQKIQVITGGLKKFLESQQEIADSAIVSVGVEELKNTTVQLLNFGVKKILVEKPGGLNIEEIKSIKEIANEKSACVYVGYNRRFFASVLKAQEIIKEDGGVTSFNFEFTEFSHVIEKILKAPGVKESWFIANSTHVVDLAFYLGGEPKEITCYTAGRLSWHPAAAVFSGAGISISGALFSYQANWTAPGRWALEVMTRKHRLIFKPMEKLQIQNIGSVTTEFVDIDDKIDTDFKPGLFKQVEAFLNEDYEKMCTITRQCNNMKIYNQMLH